VPAPQARQAPRPRVVTLTAKEFGTLLVQATLEGVPKPPTWDDIAAWRRTMGR